MKFLVEIDHSRSAEVATPAQARAFIDAVIFPTLDRAEQLAQDGRIVAGGPVAGRIALRFIADAASAAEVDELVTSLPLWTVAETRVTPLIEFGDRRAHVQALRDRLPDA